MSTTLEHETATPNPADSAREWLQRFAQIMTSRSFDELGSVYTEDATWHDFVAFTWDFTNRIGLAGMREGLTQLGPVAKPRSFTMSTKQAPKEFADGIYVFFDFVTEHRICRGMARLDRQENGELLATQLETEAKDLIEHRAAVGTNRPLGREYNVVKGRTRYSDDRQKELSFENEEPQVVILGGGHNGLSAAAQLRVFGVKTLVVERNARVGDNWRRRYSALALHSYRGADHLAHVPFTDAWPEHTPKDKFADYLEYYAKAMDLNVWTGTEIEGVAFDEEEERWTLKLRRSDGSMRIVHPRHFVIATGLNGRPRIPEVDGIEDFQGEVVHSDDFQEGAHFKGKRAIVVGAAVSGHEIVHDLYEHGADVTIVQRSATYVINWKTMMDRWYAVWQPEVGLTSEFADQIFHAMPLPATWKVNQELTAESAEVDRELLNKLEARGFKLDMGPDGIGGVGNHLFYNRDSYQINCGASELIADGLVGLKQGVEIVKATKNSVIYSDGTEQEADLIVFATGYHPLLDTMRPFLGKAGDKVQKVYGLAEDGEYSECWRRSKQPGLWFANGFVAIARHYSRFTGILIKAIEAGIIPFDPEAGKSAEAEAS